MTTTIDLYAWRNSTSGLHACMYAWLIYLRAEAEGVAGESGAREEGQPALRPAPGRVEAPVHEHQRRPLAPSGSRGRGRGRSRRVLGDDLKVEAAGQAVRAAGLALLKRVGARGTEGPGPPPPRHHRCRRRPRWHWWRHGEAGKDEGGGRGGHGHGRRLVVIGSLGCRCDAVGRPMWACDLQRQRVSSDKMATAPISLWNI
jgi:hypothetical protein